MIELLVQDSEQVITNALVDRTVCNSPPLSNYQFERIGYFSLDPNSTDDKVSRIWHEGIAL